MMTSITSIIIDKDNNNDGVNTIVKRPWGYYKLLHNYPEKVVVKLIVVDPLQSLSYQSHKYKDEQWTIVSGGVNATVTIDDKEYSNNNNNNNIVKYGSTFKINAGQKHSIKNTHKTEKLEFIEVCTTSVDGVAIKEDDIIRYVDMYGRETKTTNV